MFYALRFFDRQSFTPAQTVTTEPTTKEGDATMTEDEVCTAIQRATDMIQVVDKELQQLRADNEVMREALNSIKDSMVLTCVFTQSQCLPACDSFFNPYERWCGRCKTKKLIKDAIKPSCGTSLIKQMEDLKQEVAQYKGFKVVLDMIFNALSDSQLPNERPLDTALRVTTERDNLLKELEDWKKREPEILNFKATYNAINKWNCDNGFGDKIIPQGDLSEDIRATVELLRDEVDHVKAHSDLYKKERDILKSRLAKCEGALVAMVAANKKGCVTYATTACAMVAINANMLADKALHPTAQDEGKE